MLIPTTVLTETGAGGGGGLFDAYAYLRDEKAANTSGGNFTSGSWQTRTLNTEVFDPDGIVTLSSNQFTLQAGTYLIVARAPAYAIDRNKLKLRNITDSTDDLIGTSCHASPGAATEISALLFGRITIASAKTYELQHRCQSTSNTFGFGVESNFGVIEVYAEVEIWREAA